MLAEGAHAETAPTSRPAARVLEHDLDHLPEARRRGRLLPAKTSARSRNSHGRPRQPRPTTTPSQPVSRIMRSASQRLPDVAVSEHRDPASRAASARRSHPSAPRRRRAARRCGRAAPPRRSLRSSAMRPASRKVRRRSSMPMRNLIVTGTLPALPHRRAHDAAQQAAASRGWRLRRRGASPCGPGSRSSCRCDRRGPRPPAGARPRPRSADRRRRAAGCAASRSGRSSASTQRLGVALDERPRRDHLAHVEAGAEAPAERAERRVGDPGHRFNGTSAELDRSLYTVLSVSLPPSDINDMLLFNLDISGVSIVTGGSPVRVVPTWGRTYSVHSMWCRSGVMFAFPWQVQHQGRSGLCGCYARRAVYKRRDLEISLTAHRATAGPCAGCSPQTP